jgi:hypothetical protein
MNLTTFFIFVILLHTTVKKQSNTRKSRPSTPQHPLLLPLKPAPNLTQPILKRHICPSQIFRSQSQRFSINIHKLIPRDSNVERKTTPSKPR